MADGSQKLLDVGRKGNAAGGIEALVLGKGGAEGCGGSGNGARNGRKRDLEGNGDVLGAIKESKVRGVGSPTFEKGLSEGSEDTNSLIS